MILWFVIVCFSSMVYAQSYGYDVYSDSIILAVPDSIPFLGDSQQNIESARNTPQPQLANGIYLQGMKGVSVNVGSAGNAIFEQSLRISATGEVHPGVHLEAYLNDENTRAIDPDNSIGVQELDEILLRLYGNGFSLRFGDFPTGLQGSQLTIMPVTGLGWDIHLYNQYSQVQHFDIQSRGQVKSIWFNGQDGVQRGYSPIFGYTVVVPESESIWKNGTLLIRGIDYTMDYATGELIFSMNSPIKSRDRFLLQYQEWTPASALQTKGYSVGVGNALWNMNWDRLQQQWGDSSAHEIWAWQFGFNTQQFVANLDVGMSVMEQNPDRAIPGMATLYRWEWKPLQLYHTGAKFQNSYHDIQSREQRIGLAQKWSLDSISQHGYLTYDELGLKVPLSKEWHVNMEASLVKDSLAESEGWQSSVHHTSPQSGSALTYRQNYVNVFALDYPTQAHERAALQSFFQYGFIKPQVQAQLEREWAANIQWTQHPKKQYWLVANEIGILQNSWSNTLRLEQEQTTVNTIDSMTAQQWSTDLQYGLKQKWVRGGVQGFLRKLEVLQNSANSQKLELWGVNSNQKLGNEQQGFTTQWKYGLGSEITIPLVQQYKTVAEGTGEFRFDSLENRFIEDADKGYLIYEGMVPDTLAARRINKRIEWNWQTYWQPGLLWGIQQGIARDIRLGVHLFSNSLDSSATQNWVPVFVHENMIQMNEASSGIRTEVLWYLPDDSWNMKWNFARQYSILSGLYASRFRLLSNELQLGHQFMPTVRIISELKVEEEWRSAFTRSEYVLYEPAVECVWNALKHITIRPKYKYRVANGLYNGDQYNAQMQFTSLLTTWQHHSGVSFEWEGALIHLQSEGSPILSYPVSQGYAGGYTKRMEVVGKMEWLEDLHFSMRYVVRQGEQEKLYQTAKMETRAYF
jgi:hypothetical protein